MTSNMMHFTAAAHQSELRRVANEHNRHRVVRDGGTGRLHGVLHRLHARTARPARQRIAVPRISI